MSVEKPDVVASLRSYYERRRHAEFKSLTDCSHRPAHSDVCRKCSRLSGDPIHDMGVERRPVTVPFEKALSGDFPLLRHDFTPPPEGWATHGHARSAGRVSTSTAPSSTRTRSSGTSRTR